jgi:hypothetical protein
MHSLSRLLLQLLMKSSPTVKTTSLQYNADGSANNPSHLRNDKTNASRIRRGGPIEVNPSYSSNFFVRSSASDTMSKKELVTPLNESVA